MNHQSTTAAPGILTPGTTAPEFELPVAVGKTLSLRQLRGKPVVLAFYPADFSPVCGDQLALYNEILPDFADYDAQLYGVSCDGIFCHAAYRESRNLKFDLLSDFEPKGAVSRRYGVYDAKWGTSLRALFVIDPASVIRWSYLSPIDVNPGADGILAALDEMKGAAAR